MSINDLTFSVSGETIYDPLSVTTTTITVTNYGDDDLTGLGIYIVPATSIGDVDYPASYPPETDYEDLLTWGTATDNAEAAQGGLYYEVPTNSGTSMGYITRSSGSLYSNRIDFIDLLSGDSADFELTFEAPIGEPARRFYIDLRLE